MTIFAYKNWPEIQKSEINTSDFCQISGDWGELGIPSLVRILLIKFYWMLRNTKVTAFYHFWVIKEKPTGGKTTSHPLTHTHTHTHTHVHTNTPRLGLHKFGVIFLNNRKKSIGDFTKLTSEPCMKLQSAVENLTQTRWSPYLTLIQAKIYHPSEKYNFSMSLEKL